MRTQVLALTLIGTLCALPATARAAIMPQQPPSQADSGLVTDPSGFVGMRGVNDDPSRWSPPPSKSTAACPSCPAPGPAGGPPPREPASR